LLKQSPQCRENLSQRSPIDLLDLFHKPAFHLGLAYWIRPKKYRFGIKVGSGRQTEILADLLQLFLRRALSAADPAGNRRDIDSQLGGELFLLPMWKAVDKVADVFNEDIPVMLLKQIPGKFFRASPVAFPRLLFR
jgi:hypothetical protein